MEKERDKSKEIVKEIRESTEKEIVVLKKELQRLKELKRQKELKKQQIEQSEQSVTTTQKEETIVSEEKYQNKLEDIEARLNDIDRYLLKQFEEMDKSTYTENASYIEGQLQKLEEEIIGEKGVIEKELSAYEKLLETYTWIEEPKYSFMYTIPNKKKNPTDYQSWRIEWGKVLFDYAKYAVLHIVYLKQLHTEKPFSNFEDRKNAIREIALELIDQKLAKFLSKDEDKLRIYWKSLDLWAEDFYNWALDFGKLEPILIYEIRESKQEFSTLPKMDLEEIFKLLNKDDKGRIIKLNDGQIAFKIKLE
jgi:AraC-like DNA-binding protein